MGNNRYVINIGGVNYNVVELDEDEVQEFHEENPDIYYTPDEDVYVRIDGIPPVEERIGDPIRLGGIRRRVRSDLE